MNEIKILFLKRQDAFIYSYISLERKNEQVWKAERSLIEIFYKVEIDKKEEIG